MTDYKELDEEIKVLETYAEFGKGNCELRGRSVLQALNFLKQAEQRAYNRVQTMLLTAEAEFVKDGEFRKGFIVALDRLRELRKEQGDGSKS